MIPRSRKRLLGLYVVALAMLVVLGGRLWYLQVLDTTQYKSLAQVNQTRTIVVPAVRGMITDDTGQALVTNQTSMTVSVNMMQLSQTTSDDGKAVLARLAPLLHLSDKTLTEKVRLCTRGVPQPCWTGSPYQPIPVAEHVSDTIALQIMEEPTLFPGVTAQLSPVTDYPMPDGANPAQVLGYLQPITQAEMAKQHLPETGFAGDDLVGQSGLEAQYNTALTGKPGKQIVSVNAAGDVLGTVGGTPAQTGDTLVTSLNAKVQAVAQQALNSAIARSRAAGNNRQPGRGRRRDDHRPDRRDGQLPGLQPERVGQRDLPAGGQLPVRHRLPVRLRRAGGELGDPGAVRARLDVQGHLDRRRGRRRVPAARALRLPGLGEHRRPHVHQRRQRRTWATCRSPRR